MRIPHELVKQVLSVCSIAIEPIGGYADHLAFARDLERIAAMARQQHAYDSGSEPTEIS